MKHINYTIATQLSPRTDWFVVLVQLNNAYVHTADYTGASLDDYIDPSHLFIDFFVITFSDRGLLSYLFYHINIINS